MPASSSSPSSASPAAAVPAAWSPRYIAARVIGILVSLHLTVITLALATILVFMGTIAQVEMGLYGALQKYFQCFFVMWQVPGTEFEIPIFPGGYLIGSVLLMNLICSHFYRFRFSWSKLGIWLTHFGLIVMLAGGLMTDLFSVESFLSLDLNQSKNYTESHRQAELALIDTTDSKSDTVYTVPQTWLEPGRTIDDPRLPVKLRVNQYYPNIGLNARSADNSPPPGTPPLDGLGERLAWKGIPESNRIERPNRAAAVIEVLPSGSAGTSVPRIGAWFVADGLPGQELKVGDKTYKIVMRPKRYYKSYSMTLTKFTFDRYAGTEIPKNFASTVRITNPEHHEEDRNVLIYMNNPLRYMGETFYQNSVSNEEKTSILQVVRNPNWLLPYISCGMMTIGMLLQFGTHLSRYLSNKKRTERTARAYEFVSPSATPNSLL